MTMQIEYVEWSEYVDVSKEFVEWSICDPAAIQSDPPTVDEALAGFFIFDERTLSS